MSVAELADTLGVDRRKVGSWCRRWPHIATRVPAWGRHGFSYNVDSQLLLEELERLEWRGPAVSRAIERLKHV